ncbi:F-actin-monooxygenase Mical isoform X6 [Coccinella septempunctata]|uniref:F-actin-monooxygenase Mical isoform X6 n=1 Tax=Coccinella septempunctata TaxID=41139 RepID=UPI001D061BE4|nr:F-actin-monooxygenase Mical isoform X6 [Coccinella septempunctata]
MFHGDTRTTGTSKAGTTISQAQALEYFEQFMGATTLKNILGYFRTMCELIHLKPTYLPLFYPKLKAMLNGWKAKAIWKKLDSRANHKCYGKGKIGEKTRVLVIGGGPCGLRTAIEAQLLGCKVVVVEKRDRLSRNNVLHLWPFVIEDLRALGAKKFFGKFCAGAIDHISIRQLQCILLKVALVLGVEIHTEVSFESLVEPSQDEKIGWRAQVKPSDHPVSQYEFDVIIGADGKRNTLTGFKRKEFRGKLAIAITANFINKRTEAEARVEEISGVAFIFNQKFFKDLYHETGIDLENIVYYKDETHYFVMTAKKTSLIEKGVILQDLAETERLLAPDNVNREALLNYAKEAADFSTNYQMSNMEFAVNHYGQPDVAMFDFTSMYAAENASKVLERNGYQLLMILVGDSLLEPFWPTGSGCARGFLSSLDAAWAIRTWSLGKASPLEVLAERESTYRLLAQTTPDNLNKDWKSYTLDPSTRYPNLNRATVTPHQLVSLYDTDDIQNIEKLGQNVDKVTNISRKRRREIVDSEILIEWVKRQVESHPSIKITDLSSIFHSGKVLCAIINHYRPDLIDYSSIVNNEATQNNQLAIDVLEKDIGISPIMTGQEITSTQDNLALTAYLTQIYDVFKSEIPHVKHPKLRNIWTISDLAVPKQSLESYSLSVNSPNDSGVAIKKSQSESMNKLVMKYSTSTLTTDFSGDDSIFKLYPYFLSTKPSECGTETDLHQEKEISFKDPVEQCQELQAIETAKAMSIKNTSTEMPRKMLTQFPGNFSFKLRSKLVQKKCSLKKSVRNFQDQFQIQELEFNTSNLADGSRELYFIEILDKKRKFSPFFKPSRTTLIMTANTSYPTKVIRTEKSNDRCVNGKCRIPKEFHINFSSDPIMCDAEEKESISPEQVFSRVSNWIESNDFEEESESTEVVNNKTEPIETNIEEGFSDITSITKCLEKKSMGKEKKLIVGELFDSKGDISKQDEEKFPNKLKALACNQMFKTLGKLSHFTLFPNEAKLESPAPFSVIMEGQESELPESKNTVTSFKTLLKEPSAVIASNVASRPSSRHKRHVEGILSNKSANIERKTRKRRTLDKSGSVAEIQKQFEEGNSSKSSRLSKRQQQRKRHAEHFIKSMQMLAANAKPDCPFEDYSIFVYRQTARNFEDRVKDLEKKFTYIPEYDTKVPSLIRTNTDDEFAAKIKSIEEGWQSRQLVEKKPKDLMRKIGKIETSDWNIKEIEKKIKENKLGKPIVRDKEKVPKWSREQFVARQTKLEKLDRQDSAEAKYADIDKNLKHLELKLKEGTNRDLGQNKIASITEKLTSKIPEPPEPVVPKSVDKPVIIPSYSGSEFCHFCNKRVYLMERLSAEGRFFHHGCFKCQYCRAQLRLGSYAFDKDGIYGHKFFCLHHYGMQGKAPTTTKVARKPSQRDTKPTSKKLTGVSGVDLLDRVRTPERAEFSNLSLGSSDLEDSISQMDEDEWTDRNFGASTAEIGSSDDEDDSSSYSDTDSDDEDAYEEAMEEPATKEGTLKWAERMSKRHYSKQDKSDSEPYGSSDSSSYYENSTDDDESDTATEGEEEIRARELRLQEVRLEPPIIQADTGTDTEVFSDENSSDASSEIQNSATEISTDSEFAQDDPTPTSEVPAILLNDLYINTTRGSSSNRPKKIQVTSGFLQKPSNGKALKQDIELKLTPLVSPAPSLRKLTSSIKPPSEPYALNRTQSTGGIATKVSLELKKKYLLGESIGGSGGGNIQKSGSASTLDTKLKSFCSNISDCQKLLKPAPEISASMQTFCKKLDENISPILSPLTVKTFSKPTSPIESNENEENKNLPPPDLINVTVTEKKEEKDVSVFENETEGRPRSPLHETSLIVPEIDWKKVSHCAESLSSSSTTSSSSDEQIKTPNLSHKNIPTVEVCEVEDCQEIVKNSHETSQKSISSDKKQLNQPKTLPGLKTDAKKIPQEAGYQKMLSQDDRSSACSTPISVGDDMTNAFTETELSDWARDGGVSDDLEGVAFDLNEEEPRKQTIPDLHTIGHICGKTEEENEKEPLSANFDSIEFMDTCTESNSEEGVVNSITYNILNNEEIAEDSLNPIINNIVEAQNTVITEMKIKNSGYCIIASDNNNFGGKVVNLRPADVEHLKQNQNLCEREEDSLLVVETTTEENTCSDSTVKNVTEIPKDFNSASNTQKQRLEEKLSQLKKEKEDILLQARIEKEIEKKEKENETKDIRNIEFDEHCQRLQSKVDFGNVKDSIDIRKSRRRSKDSPQKPDFIQEEKQCLELKNSLKDITLNLSPTIKTPDQIYNKEVIEKERNVNQRLVQEMVMSKMRAENKALDRKIRNRPTTNILNKTVQLSKSATADIAKMNMGNLDNSMKRIVEHTSGNFVLKEKEPIVGMSSLQKSQTSPNVLGDNRSIYDLEITPIAPPRSKDLKNATDKLKSEARARAKMLSNEELGLSPEDKLLRLREKSRRYERSANSECSEFQLYPTALNSQTPVSSKDASRKSRPISEYLPKYDNRKSFSPVGGKGNDKKMCRSDSNLFRTVNDKDKVKDESPKKGIKFTKIMDLFSKKSPKGLFSKISPKSKDVSKSCPTLFEWTPMTTEKVSLPKGTKMKGVQEVLPQRSSPEIPPPVPPLPLCYTESLLRRSEDSSDDDFKCSKKSSSENLGGPVNLDDSVSSLTERHSCKRSRRSVREAQLKRHRMAQEIQRKLEETEVKTKELEDKGVMIEKALRGEDGEGSSKQESELLQEWFDIMRDRTELRRYEKELMVRAQELELEDRHARLQHQLRKRLKEENKSEEDKEIDYKIINEMLEIVSKRDSLIALLEEDRLRYLSEDRDFEEQMLAKDLHLTPKWKTSEK